MKLSFSSRISRLNLAIAFCTLAITASNLPVQAIPQEVCVKTSTGDIACGTPVPKPSSKPGRGDTDVTIDTQTDPNGVTWELKSCIREERNIIHCSFVLSTSKDSGYDIKIMRGTKLVNNLGKEFSGGRLKVGDQTLGGDNYLSFNMTQGAQYKTSIYFPDVAASVSEITLLQVQVYYNQLVKFRNVPIN